MNELAPNLEELIASYSKIATLSAIASLVILSAISLKVKQLSPNLKKALFLGIVFVTVACTMFLASSTLYLNTVSSSKGPVHYHADFEIWRCGQKEELEDPRGLSNKIGTTTVHEHNDKRIHIEGVVVEPQDASLGNFFSSVGGKLTDSSLTFPSHEGLTTLKTGDICANVTVAQLQVFVYKVQGVYYSQSKIQNPQDYIISPENNVPPGDCITIELDRQKNRTDKLCQSFEVAKQAGKLKEELKR